MAITNIENGSTLSLVDMTATHLRNNICKGKYAVGQKMDAEHSLAKKLGVSRGTIRQALNILTNERLVVRHQGRGTFVTNPTYGSVVETQTALLGIMAYDREYFGKIIEGASAKAASRGYMLVTGSNFTNSEGNRNTETFLRNNVHGMIMSTGANYKTTQNYDRFIAAGIPVVMLDTTLPGCEEDFVGPDDYHGILKATHHLIDLGHKKLAYVGHDNRRDTPCRLNRQRGFLDACDQANINIPDSWIIETNERDYQPVLQKLLNNQDRPTAFVTFNDIWAIRVIDTARNIQLNVPNDVSVVGFDDSNLARNCDIPLTTVRPEFEQIGQEAIDMLIDKNGANAKRPKKSVLIAPRLVIRKSTSKLTGKI